MGENRNFSGKVVIITGSSSGIGAASAINFAKLGAQVVVTGRNQEKVKHVAEECAKASQLAGYNHSKVAIEVVADVANDDDCKRLVESTIENFGKIDVLVNNAGAGLAESIFDKNYMEHFDTLMRNNLRSTVLLTHLTVGHLERTKGTVINVSSIGSLKPNAHFSVYCMTKCAMDMFTKCLAIELGPKGIRVNSINPGATKTNFNVTMGLPQDMSDKLFDDMAAITPLRKYGEPEDIAKAIEFLASDHASFITGITLVQDGGGIYTFPSVYEVGK